MHISQRFFVFLLGFQVVVALYPSDRNCKWSRCESKSLDGVTICEESGGGGRYSGNSNSEGCRRHTYRVECCESRHQESVKWTSCVEGGNYGESHGANRACRNDCGPDFRPTGNQKRCPGSRGLVSFECRNRDRTRG